ncbi:MAG: carbohydrate ABC transporter permease [Lachnospiraceae bacterium]
MVAYGFARANFKGKRVLFLSTTITMMLPNQVIMIPQYIIFNMLGWVNTPSPIIVPAWCAKPLFIFMIMQFIEGIPRDLDEAANMDGRSPYTIFTRITLPLAKPAMVTCAIFEFYWKWDDYMGSLLYLNSPEKYTVSIALEEFYGPHELLGLRRYVCDVCAVPAACYHYFHAAAEVHRGGSGLHRYQGIERECKDERQGIVC